MTDLLTIFDFSTSETLSTQWQSIDDVVMGGVSQSKSQIIFSHLLFTGQVSTANSGGFASIRSTPFNPPLDLSQYQGIVLKLQGDGKRYKFIARCENQWDGLSYCYSFDTIYKFTQTLHIPFKDLRPVLRAKTVNYADPFNTKQIYSLQFMYSIFEYDGALNPTFQEGSFLLEVASIQAYK